MSYHNNYRNNLVQFILLNPILIIIIIIVIMTPYFLSYHLRLFNII